MSMELVVDKTFGIVHCFDARNSHDNAFMSTHKPVTPISTMFT